MTSINNEDLQKIFLNIEQSLDICFVGLEGIENGYKNTPEDTVIPFVLQIDKLPTVRSYIIKSLYIFLASTFEEYVLNIITKFFSDNKELSNSEDNFYTKFSRLVKKINCDDLNKKIIVLKVMLIVRNYIVHGDSELKLSKNDLDILSNDDSFKQIKINYEKKHYNKDDILCFLCVCRDVCSSIDSFTKVI